MPKRKGRAPAGCYWRGEFIWGRVTKDGKQYRWSLDTDDVGIAKARRKAGADRVIALKHGDLRRTLQEVAEAWVNWVCHEVSPKTVTRYAVSLEQLDPFLTGKYLDQIDGNLIAEIIRVRRAASKVTGATIKRDLGALSSVMNFAIDQGWIESNPVLPRLKRIKERRDPITLPTQADVAKMAARAPGQLSAMILAARATGCRQEELASATRSQLDLERGRLTVIGKRNKLRVIDLEPFEAWRVFASLPAGAPRAPLFWHGAGERYANVSARFGSLSGEVAKKDADFRRYRFHHLRHLHAVEWLRSGRSIYALQQRLGHGSVKTTEVYLQYLTPDEQLRCKGGSGIQPEDIGHDDQTNKST